MSQFLSAWAGIDDSAHVAVAACGDAAEAATRLSDSLVASRVASRIGAGDPTVWGPGAESEAAVRLGWTDQHQRVRDLLPQLEALVDAARHEGKVRVVLAGMGGASLGPEVICASHGVPLITLDSTDPDQVRSVLDADLNTTIVVVSSKSGTTVETDAQRRILEEAFEAEGLDPRKHIVVVTDPGSPLHTSAVQSGYRDVFLADPHVGGRFSALSAFGLVPAALAGVPVTELLDEAAAVADSFAEDDAANPALVLGGAIAGSDRTTLVFTDEGSGLVGLADWIEQLIAESTGKDGIGLLPVVAEAGPPEATATDALTIRMLALSAPTEVTGGHQVVVAGTLGAQFLLWEYATAIAGQILGVNPFDQPDVEAAKAATRALLGTLSEPEAAQFTDHGIEVYGTDGLLNGVNTLQGALDALEATLGERGYLAVMAYLNREANPALPSVRHGIAHRIGRPVTFGWGPRFLHSTGQLHKGGAPVGVFLQITGTFAGDLDIPGRPFSFSQLISAQATGDAHVLAEHGRPVLRFNLTDASHVAHVAALLEG